MDTPTAETAARLAKALGPKFQVRGLLGRGGFAEVYEVFDVALDRKLAVKVLRPDIAWTTGTLARFQQEARAIARLQHGNILPIFFVGDAEQLSYYGMPFVDGTSLADYLKERGKLPVPEALRIVKAVLDALQHAHDAGLVHRDIKPENVMIEKSGRVLLVDFGIAKAMQGDAGLTQTGFVVGTPHYMAPEQALGQPGLDGRTDLYAVGAVLYQLLIGAPPFEGDSSQEIVGKHIADAPPMEKLREAGVPEHVTGMVAKCLAKKREDRWSTAEQAAHALGAAPPAATEALTTPLPRVAAQPPKPKASRRGLWAAAGILVPVLAVAGWWFTRSPELVVTNRLAIAINVVAGDTVRVAPGETLAIPLRRGESGRLTWHTLPGGPAGTIAVAGARGRMERTATARNDSAAWFAPHITNETGIALSLVINAGLRGETPCDCTIPPGAVRQLVGYFPLFANSSVQARTRDGRRATFPDLGPEVDPVTGVVNLRFTGRDLR